MTVRRLLSLLAVAAFACDMTFHNIAVTLCVITMCVAQIMCQNLPGLLPSGSNVELKISREEEGLGMRLLMYTIMYNNKNMYIHNVYRMRRTFHVHKMSSLQKKNEAHVSSVITVHHEYTCTDANSSSGMAKQIDIGVTNLDMSRRGPLHTAP